MLRSYLGHQVEDAPDTPGLYAWYGTIASGRADWEELIRDGEDLGERRSRTLLRAHAERHGGPPLDVAARAGSINEYSGTLEHKTNGELAQVLGTKRGDAPETSLDQTLADARTRRVLLDMLSHSAPVFAAPLYIGVSGNLRRRLGQHIESLTKLWAHVSRDPEYLAAYAREERGRSSFSVRAVERGFSVDNVRVWIMEVVDHDELDALSSDERRAVAESSEWILNRCHRPILGRK